MKRTQTLTLMLIAVAALLPLFAASQASAHDNSGYIYGKISTRSGNSYTGLLRWDGEETFWTDLFHSNKESRPFEEYLEDKVKVSKREARDLEREIEQLERQEENLERDIERLERRWDRTDDPEKIREFSREVTEHAEQIAELAIQRAQLEQERAQLEAHGESKTISVLGGTIQVGWNDWNVVSGRLFIARFGDIKKIEVIGSEDARVTMKTGTTYTVSGYSNDVGSDITVRDSSLGDLEIAWKKIDTIEFMETPSSVDPWGWRLNGTVETDAGIFSGWIQWDSEECVSTDELDGDSEDGSVSIPMGNIKSIERRSRSSSWVELQDGRRMLLEGSNDVNNSIRGILVYDDRYGRIEIPWDAFDKVDFGDEKGSGPGYDDYRPKKIQGKVTARGGEEYEGYIVYDLDESESWEMLNGDHFDLEFDVPFEFIESIKPLSRRATEITLIGDETLRLESGQDVTESNDGLLILKNENDEDPEFVEWDRVERIELK